LKVYIDTSVTNIYLFGKFSEKETSRSLPVHYLFKLINSGKTHAVISLYSIQEIYAFCKKIFHPDEAGHIARLALSVLFQNEFELTGLLRREDQLLHRRKFIMNDLTDLPHAISAYLNNCAAIVTYDSHFQKIKSKISVYTPEELIPLVS
jgi:predicted nucleic acid-binding protein